MRLAGAMIAAFLLAACDWSGESGLFTDDLALAQEAAARRDWPAAERLSARYLREEQDPENRWEAWNLLLEALNAVSHEPRASLECLDVMLLEYEEDEPKLARILEQMGKYNESQRYYDRAANAWSAYCDLSTLTFEERAAGLRRLARNQIAQRHFDSAEEILHQCLALPYADREKVWCMLDLAEASAGREQWREAADLCQQILDSNADGEILGMAGYLLGDALEQMGQNSDALKHFEQARDHYPNPAVMDNRIEWLKKGQKK